MVTDAKMGAHCPLHHKEASMATRQSAWALKVASIIQGGNIAAALAQIKVAPTVKDVQQLRSLLTTSGQLAKHKVVDEVTADQIAALSAPRLHRSP
jgi:pheromone shutdown protein TraB